MSTITEENSGNVKATCAELDAFQQLVESLRDALGPCSGIDSAHVDPNHLQSLMRSYMSRPSEWKKYALSDMSRSYTRNLVDKGNGKSNLLVLVWNPGKGSPIHDHSNAHCVMKVLYGSLKETLYAWPDQELVERGRPSPPAIRQETIYTENDVTYISDEIGLHRISNPDPKNIAVSLHLYTPPNAATYGCHTFDERTGRATRIRQCNFYSELGHRL